jgi:anti-anti-sigma factor
MYTGDGVFPSGSRPRLTVELEDDPVACSFVSTRDYARCAVLALQGELDITDRAELSSRLAAAASCGPWVIVDLTNLAFIDCSSLGVLAGAREQAQLAGGDMLLAGPRGVVALLLLLLAGRAGEFSVFPGVGAAAFSAGLAAFGLRLAAARRRKSLAAATEGMVTAAATSGAVNAPAQQDPRAISVQLARVTKGQSRLLRVSEVGCSAALSAMIYPIPKLTVRVRFRHPLRCDVSRHQGHPLPR